MSGLGVTGRWVAIGLAGAFAFAPARASEEARNELIRIQNEWAAARVKPDIAYLERLYAREFRVQNIAGSVVSREADIDVFASGKLKPDFVRDEDMDVSLYGDTAVVTGVENVGGTYKGNYDQMAIRFTNVFVRRDGRWQLVLHQGTRVPKKP